MLPDVHLHVALNLSVVHHIQLCNYSVTHSLPIKNFIYNIMGI